MTGAQDREMTTDPAEAENEDNQSSLQEMGFPGEVARAQGGQMTTDPVEAQGDNAGDEDAEGESDREHQEQLA